MESGAQMGVGDWSTDHAASSRTEENPAPDLAIERRIRNIRS
jgi:hypothetical protein